MTNPVLKDKQLLLGVCGSIAAYKSVYLARLLVKRGASVQVLMTPGAHDFIRPLTFSTVTHKPVYTHFSQPETGEWNNHVELAENADAFLIAPATANTMAKMANGLCDNLLTAAYLSCTAPVIIAPAMDREMYKHPSTNHNIETLRHYGHHIISAETGELASGLIGQGRMAEPERIIETAESVIDNLSSNHSKPLKGQKALVTAGPTHEPIDAVRYIGNRSSGKMGFAIAESLAQKGAEVTLVTGPTNLTVNHSQIERVNVETAQQMYEACTKAFPNSEIAILAAAVADIQPQSVKKSKQKKEDFSQSIKVKPTKDILAELGKQKTDNQKLIGFALETDNEIENAKQKLENKNLDFIVLNSPNDPNSGFQFDTNKVTIIDRDGNETPYPLQSKQKVADHIVDYLLQLDSTTKTTS